MKHINFNYLKEKGDSFLAKTRGKKAIFLCTIAHTETSSIPGISAAGASQELIKFTPAADIEAIYYGEAKCLNGVPENPLGPPSPVIITIASLNLLKIPFLPINAGCKIIPQTPLIEINNIFGDRIDYGIGLNKININNVIEKTTILAREIAKTFQFVILGESVPGGTTTAMALINALGYNSFNKICGSMPGNQHNLKIEVVKKALSYIKNEDSIFDKIRKIADPMQPVQAILAIELAKRDVNVLLAGGTQMVAIATLITHLTKDENIFNNIAIGTTKWVAEDKSSDITGLMKDIHLNIPLISSQLSFSNSNFQNLKLYEQGYVKEGVGAGGIAITVFNELNISSKIFLDEIEKVYKKIYCNISTKKD